MSENSSSEIKLYSDVRTTQVQWLWYPFIALGKLTLLQGDPGDGKSTMMLNLIAAISNGGTTPDGQAFGCPHRVIYQCSEDGVEDTIKPRLENCGANCVNVAFIDEETHGGLTLDDERIRQSIASFRPWLVVIDPVQAYVGNDADLQVAGRARKLMRRLGIWASTYDCAIVLIGHLNKREGSKNLYRSLGSIDVVAAARSVLQVERDEEDEDIRVVRQIKNSLAPIGNEIRYEIRPESGFKWLVSSEGSEPISVSDSKELQSFETKQDKAVYLIKKYLSAGDMRSKEVFMRLRDEGIGQRTAEIVKQEMGVQSYRVRQEWFWTLGQK
ncbi:MAG: AAA family ATPase [Lachnospiraceae bacterium]|nr:AAA family ATPase [Lachnospiraceae bacterium]